MSKGFQNGNRFGQGAVAPSVKWYRCIYCKQRISDISKLPSHEAQCPFRAVVRMQWQMALAKAKHKESKGK